MEEVRVLWVAVGVRERMGTTVAVETWAVEARAVEARVVDARVETGVAGARQCLPVGTARRGTDDVHAEGAERMDQLRLQLRVSPPVRREHDLRLRRLRHALQERERERLIHRATGTAKTSGSRAPPRGGRSDPPTTTSGHPGGEIPAFPGLG